MRPWATLNALGRMLLICCVLNVWASIVFAINSDPAWMFSIFMGMFCGLSTYHPRYKRK